MIVRVHDKMDKEKTIEDLKLIVSQFCKDRDWDQFHNAKELAIGLIIEAGELLEKFRFKTLSEVEDSFKNPSYRGEIEDELADILYFLLRISDLYKIDLSSAFIAKMNKNANRYPVERSKGSNQKYTDL